MGDKKNIVRYLMLSVLVILIAVPFGFGTGEALTVGKQAGANIEKSIKEIEQLITSGNLDKIKIKAQEIDKNYQQAVKDLVKTRDFLKSKKADPKILARLDVFEKGFKTNIGGLVNILNKAKKISDFRNALVKIKDINQKNTGKSYGKIQNPTPFKATGDGKIIKKKISNLEIKALKTVDLKISNLKLKKNENQEKKSFSAATSQIFQQNLIQTESIPLEYLAETEEIEFSQSIKNLADGLDKDPLKILNYVKNNIDYVPYYGIKKGADATLIEKAGNDFDQSALLISLLRYSEYPAKYERGQIKLGLNQAMNLLGVDDPIVAAELLSKTRIPYILYTDQNDNPLFFSIEHIWVEAYITYDYTRGINQNTNLADKMWVPMEPSLKTVYYSQLADIIDEMGFNVNNFYENYLQGNYSQQKPIEAYQQEIENYLSANHPDLTYEDILTKGYKNSEKLEFIPNTLPYEIVENFSEYSQAPENLKHKIQFKITNKESGLELLNYTAKVHNIADKQMVLTYVAASSADQQVIDQYSSIYDIAPLSLVRMKPVIKIQGEIIAGGSSASLEITLGKKEELIMRFLVPTKNGGQLTETEQDKIEKEMLVGNDEGIAINTDRIVLPELRPSQDIQTAEFLSAQKLYRTALNFLDRLQKSNQEIAQTLGGEFTNAATRAIVFNGVDVNYQNGEPYSFDWKGLRIDSSSTINYFSHFGNDIKRNQIRFMYISGMEASLNESSIFEDDFNIEAMSTVKGLRMINQGQIPGRSMVKITSANRSVINTLNISAETKTKFRTAVDAGNIIYTANQQYTYGNFTGLVYINLNPLTGDGGYIIGEGLNGGYTVGEWTSLFKLFWQLRTLTNITANFAAPTQGQQFIKGDNIRWTITYSGLLPTQPLSWYEFGDINSNRFDAGNQLIMAGYGATASVSVVINAKTTLGGEYDHTGMDDIIIAKENKYGIPHGILKAIIHKETQMNLFDPQTSRYEPKRDFQDFSGYNADPAYPTRNINTAPFSYYRLPGINTRGQIIEKGLRVDSLPRDYKTTLKNIWDQGWQLRGIITTDRPEENGPPNGILTVDEIYANDFDADKGAHTQAWPAFGPQREGYNYTGNFTPQFLLSSSYGLGHVMYLESTEALDPQDNKIIKDSNSPHDIVDNIDLSIELAASILKSKSREIVPNDDCAGWSATILRYNPDTQYQKDVCGLYMSNYK